MRIITMQRLTLDGKPATYNTATENGDEYRDWWCVIETEEEELVYDRLEKGKTEENLWNEMVRRAGQGMGIKQGDEDIYGYIRPDETAPEIKETFKDGDGDIWVRVE